MFRRLTHDDLAMLSQWFRSPHVDRWWSGPNDVDGLRAKYGPYIDGVDQRTKHFIFELDNASVGFIQHYRVRDYPEWAEAIGMPEAAGIDYAIGDASNVGRGVGSSMISAFVAVVFDAYPDVRSIVAVPQAANIASWRALEKSGFVRTFEGIIESDPSESGPSVVYVMARA